MVFSNVFFQILVLYVIMAIGALVYRLKILGEEAVSGITKLMLYVTIPATILNGLNDSGALIHMDVWRMTILSGLSLALVFALGFFVLWALRVKREERPFYQYISVFGNIGFIGYPIVLAIIGSKGILLAAIMNIFYNTLLYSLGIYLMSRYNGDETKLSFGWRDIVTPGLVAALASIALFLLNIRLPAFIADITGTLGGLTTPLAMIVVGASINHIDLKKIAGNYRIIVISALKMIVYPIGFAYLLRGIGMTGLPAMVAVVLMGMPIAATAVIMAMEYNKKHLAKSAEATVLSTLMLLGTIPVLVFCVSIVA